MRTLSLRQKWSNLSILQDCSARRWSRPALKYRVAGGLAVFIHVDQVDPLAGRLTRDIDVAIDRRDLERVRAALDAVPGSEPLRSEAGILLAPVADLLRMKLTGFRLKDKVHIKDMDSVGLITPEIEEALPPIMRERLQEIRGPNKS